MGMVAILVMWHKPFVLTFIPPSYGGATWNLAPIRLAASKKKKLKMLNLSDLGRRSMNDLDLWYS